MLSSKPTSSTGRCTYGLNSCSPCTLLIAGIIAGVVLLRRMKKKGKSLEKLAERIECAEEGKNCQEKGENLQQVTVSSGQTKLCTSP